MGTEQFSSADLMNAIRSLEAATGAADAKVQTRLQEASVVVTDLKVSIDTRMENASKVVENLQNKVDTLAQNVHHHGAPVKPPTLSDPMAFTQPQHYAAMCLSQAEPAVLFTGARAYVQPGR